MKTSEALFNLDVTDDQANMVLNGFNMCAPQPVVDFESLTPHPLNDLNTGELLGPERTAVAPDGIYATQVLYNRVIKLNPGTGISPIVQFPTNVPNMGLQAGAGIGAYPPELGTVHYTTVIIRVDSPVEVLLTDANGRRLGAIAGQAINEFGQWGFDSGPQSHPRFYVINYPQPGSYTLQSVGTGSGPFTVHVYSVDTIKAVSQHLSSTGIASPGGMGKHDFTLDSAGGIAFNNAAPIADAGMDQAVTADASGNATVTLDGSASSDPDGDALSFTWAGPGVFATGPTAQVTLPVGVHVLTLALDDGKGASAEATVQITVNASADTTPPVLTLPADITTNATSSQGAVVTYTASALDAVDGPVAVNCTPPSGSTFAIGSTTVNCSASDAAGNVATGAFTVTVSPMGNMGVPLLTGRVVAQGVVDPREPDLRFLDLELRNSGDGDAHNVVMESVGFRVLAGSGWLRLAPKSTLPLTVGDIPVGSSTLVRLYVVVPSTVTRFGILEEGTLLDSSGASFHWEIAQEVIP